MLLCNDPIKGYFYYYCSNCNKDILRHFSCNSRICSRCGKKHVEWLLIKDDWECIKELSAMTYRVITETMEKSSKHKITPGMIASLHTYGKDMKYNVHFHTIVTEGGISSKTNLWKEIIYLPYQLLRIKWKLYALDVIIKHANKSIDNQILLESVKYNRYHNGFNVKVIKSKIPKKEIVWYIARYIRHPAISNRRIVAYDGKTVTIVCEDKHIGIKYYVKFTVDEFITRLIQHIPQKNFKMLRYYGLYSRKKNKVILKKGKQETITKYFHSKHAIECPGCGKILEPIEYFPPSYPNGTAKN